jgi:tRNA-2-methylthio-N6-dimethylallyladenosine synthase
MEFRHGAQPPFQARADELKSPEIAACKYDAFIGRQVEILVEGPSKKNAARYTGRTRCTRIVRFDGSIRHQGQLMDVKIERTGSFTLYGDPAVVNL